MSSNNSLRKRIKSDPKWSKKKILFTSLFSAAVLALALLVALLNLLYTANTSGREYSLDNMMSHILSISEKEHSVDDKEALEEVRGYISSELSRYGLENTVITHGTKYVYNEKTDEVYPYQPVNIYTEIPGNSGVNVLLLAHYDSSPFKYKYDEPSYGSHGALDDGYGVAAALELARIYSQDTGLKNGIKIAIVDAEEAGCLGSEVLVEEYSDWLSDVNLVINVEARGNTGPLYLFQTSENNSAIIDFYKKAGFPFTFSIASSVYDMLPNDTDLSPFLESGYAGLNLATLDSLKCYHNDKDVYESVDPASVAKYCDTLLPLLEEYTLNAEYGDMDYFKADGDSLFFTLLPNALVSYSTVVGWVFFALMIVMAGVLTGISVWKKHVNYKRLLVSIALDIGCILLVCGIGFIVALLGCAIAGANYHIIFVIAVSADGGILIALGILLIAAYVLSSLLKKVFGIQYNEMACGGILINTLFAIVCAAVLFEGTFVFVIPVFLYALPLIANLFLPEGKLKFFFYAAVCGIATVFTVSLYIELIYSLFVSLTFGALGMLLAVLMLPLTIFVPMILDLYRDAQPENKATEVAV